MDVENQRNGREGMEGDTYILTGREDARIAKKCSCLRAWKVRRTCSGNNQTSVEIFHDVSESGTVKEGIVGLQPTEETKSTPRRSGGPCTSEMMMIVLTNLLKVSATKGA